MDERKIQEIKAEAARQAAVGASGGMESHAADEEPSDLPKPPVAVEARTAPQEEGERQPFTKGTARTEPAGARPDDEPTQGEPAVKVNGSR